MAYILNELFSNLRHWSSKLGMNNSMNNLINAQLILSYRNLHMYNDPSNSDKRPHWVYMYYVRMQRHSCPVSFCVWMGRVGIRVRHAMNRGTHRLMSRHRTKAATDGGSAWVWHLALVTYSFADYQFKSKAWTKESMYTRSMVYF